MVALRKAGAYSKKKARPYTRNSRSKKKAFIKVVPSSKVTKFNMGNVQDYIKGKHNFILRFISVTCNDFHVIQWQLRNLLFSFSQKIQICKR